VTTIPPAKKLLFLASFALCCTIYGEVPSRQDLLAAVIRMLQKQNIALRSEKLKADAEKLNSRLMQKNSRLMQKYKS
jgi:hypothetical protein